MLQVLESTVLTLCVVPYVYNNVATTLLPRHPQHTTTSIQGLCVGDGIVQASRPEALRGEAPSVQVTRWPAQGTVEISIQTHPGTSVEVLRPPAGSLPITLDSKRLALHTR